MLKIPVDAIHGKWNNFGISLHILLNRDDNHEHLI